jgi:hypothetical protein
MQTKILKDALGPIPVHPCPPSVGQNAIPRDQRVVGTSPITGGPIVSGPKSSYRPPRNKRK